MVKVLEALRQEHASILQVLEALEREVIAFARGEKVDYDLVAAIVDYFTDFPDQQHHPKEDLIYERLRLADAKAAQGIGNLLSAHARLAQELRVLSISVTAVMDGELFPRIELMRQARAFIDHQRMHLWMEELYFFPTAEERLDVYDWAAIETQIMVRQDPLIGGKAGDRFEQLRRSLLAWSQATRPLAQLMDERKDELRRRIAFYRGQLADGADEEFEKIYRKEIDQAQGELDAIEGRIKTEA